MIQFTTRNVCLILEMDDLVLSVLAEAVICKDSWYRDLETPEIFENVSEFVKNKTE